jgi:hypothetical protein
MIWQALSMLTPLDWLALAALTVFAYLYVREVGRRR